MTDEQGQAIPDDDERYDTSIMAYATACSRERDALRAQVERLEAEAGALRQLLTEIRAELAAARRVVVATCVGGASPVGGLSPAQSAVLLRSFWRIELISDGLAPDSMIVRWVERIADALAAYDAALAEQEPRHV